MRRIGRVLIIPTWVCRTSQIKIQNELTDHFENRQCSADSGTGNVLPVTLQVHLPVHRDTAMRSFQFHVWWRRIQAGYGETDHGLLGGGE